MKKNNMMQHPPDVALLSGQEIKDIHSTYQEICIVQQSCGSSSPLLLFGFMEAGQVCWQNGLLFFAFTNGKAGSEFEFFCLIWIGLVVSFPSTPKDRRVYGRSARQRRR